MGFIGRAVVCLTADPGVTSLNPSLGTNFMDFEHEIILTVIPLLPLIQEGQFQLLEKVCAQSTD